MQRIQSLHPDDRAWTARCRESPSNRTIEPLVAALTDIDFDVRLAAAHELGENKTLQAVEPLVAALSDNVNVVRDAAAEALGKIGDGRAVSALVALLGTEQQAVGVSALLKMLERPNMKIGIDALRQMASLPATMEYRVCTTDASGSVNVREGVVDCSTLKSAASKALTRRGMVA